MHGSPPSTDRLWAWFAISSVVFVGVLAISPLKDHFREYRSYQRRFGEMLSERAGSKRELQEAERFKIGIRQAWIPELHNRIDRCGSCHLGTDLSSMDGAPQPFALHPRTPHAPDELDRFGCVSCHQGQGRATTVSAAHGDVEGWDTPLLPLRYTEASCGRCHVDREVPEAAMLSEGRRLLEDLGCFGCHALADQHDRWTSIAPDLAGLSQKTYPEWLRAWLRDPGRLRPGTRMPRFRFGDDEVEALVAFLWTRPPLTPILESEDPPAGDFARGKKLFRESRCISCHTVDGRGNGSAPELVGVASKVDARWLMAFLGDPHAFQPETPMPRYNFEQQDRLDVVQYMSEDLVDPSAPEPGPGPAWRPARRLIEEGERLYGKYGCGGCHRISGQDSGVRIGPELTGIGDKPVELLDFGKREDLPRTVTDWLAAKMTAPGSFRPGLKMPEFDLAQEQVQALITALLSSGARPVPSSYRMQTSRPTYDPPGRFGELVSRYRCLSCHLVEGRGTDISTAPLTTEGSKVEEDWLRNYLLVPTTIRPLLTDRMVPLRMTDEEATFLASFMKNVYVDNSIPGEIFPDGLPPERVSRGRRLFYERFGCQACHMIDNRGGYYGPLLDGLGRRLESGWISWWLQGPQRWRADVRCPDYGLGGEDALDLTAFIRSVSNEPVFPEGGR